eukprot:2812932-Rhodomonas_salina.2
MQVSSLTAALPVWYLEPSQKHSSAETLAAAAVVAPLAHAVHWSSESAPAVVPKNPTGHAVQRLLARLSFQNPGRHFWQVWQGAVEHSNPAQRPGCWEASEEAFSGPSAGQLLNRRPCPPSFQLPTTTLHTPTVASPAEELHLGIGTGTSTAGAGQVGNVVSRTRSLKEPSRIVRTWSKIAESRDAGSAPCTGAQAKLGSAEFGLEATVLPDRTGRRERKASTRTTSPFSLCTSTVWL